MGKMAMLVDMECAKWGAKHCSALVSFFYDLEVHPYHSRPNGESILLIYQACIHHAWHDGLMAGNMCNIAITNDNLLCSVADEFYDCL